MADHIPYTQTPQYKHLSTKTPVNTNFLNNSNSPSDRHKNFMSIQCVNHSLESQCNSLVGQTYHTSGHTLVHMYTYVHVLTHAHTNTLCYWVQFQHLNISGTQWITEIMMMQSESVQFVGLCELCYTTIQVNTREMAYTEKTRALIIHYISFCTIIIH